MGWSWELISVQGFDLHMSKINPLRLSHLFDCETVYDCAMPNVKQEDDNALRNGVRQIALGMRRVLQEPLHTPRNHDSADHMFLVQR